MLQRSTLSGLLLSTAVAAAACFSWTMMAQAQETTPASAPAESAPASEAAPPAELTPEKLIALSADFLHYSIVNNSELAKASGEVILNSTAKPEEVLKAFENANPQFRDVLTQDLRRPDLKDVATKLTDKVDDGFRVLARDPHRIRQEVERLGQGPRAYQIARDRLTASGEYAAPIFFEYLENGASKSIHPFILRVMGEIGKPLVNPLIEELKAADPALRLELVDLLGQIGYPQALPGLRSIQDDNTASAELRQSATRSIARIDGSGAAMKMSASDLYLAGARNYYGKRVSYLPLSPGEKTNPVWFFDANLNNVVPIQVPTVIWNDVMASRMAESTLRSDANNGGAISLWNAANLRREIELPAGAADPARGKSTLPAAFYAYASGPAYINPVLGMALDEKDDALALRAVDALERTGGIAGLVSGSDSPLVRALGNPERAVRFHAAFALARANPVSPFPSSTGVVPVLVEAVNSSATPTALLVSKDEDVRNAMSEALKNSDAKYNVIAAATLGAAVDQSHRSSIDLIVVPSGPEADRVADAARGDYRLSRVPVLVTAKAAEVPALTIRMHDVKGRLVIDEKSDADALNKAVATVRESAGTAAVSAETVDGYATTALELLATLAADHRSIFSVQEAVPALTDALHDKREAVVTGAAKVLGLINSAEGERALATAALNPDTDAAQRVMFFDQLRETAKRTGNALDASAVNNLIKVVGSDADAKLRLAAAGALGALNVPSNQASVLILQQAR